MKHNVRKFLSLLLAFSMVLSLMSVSVFAEYTVEDGAVTVNSLEDLQSALSDGSVTTIVASAMGITTDTEIDLRGKTIQAPGALLFQVGSSDSRGCTLTINDSVGGGRIVSTEENARAGTIYLRFKTNLVLNGGTIAGNSQKPAVYLSAGGASATINGNGRVEGLVSFDISTTCISSVSVNNGTSVETNAPVSITKTNGSGSVMTYVGGLSKAADILKAETDTRAKYTVTVDSLASNADFTTPVSVSLSEGLDITLDLGGNTINRVLSVQSGSVTIKNGTLTRASSTSNDSSLTISGGTVTIEEGATIDNGSKDDSIVATSGTLVISGGTIKGGVRIDNGVTITITGGTFTDNPTQYVSAPYQVVELTEGAEFEDGYRYKVQCNMDQAVAQITETGVYYTSLAEAIDAAQDGDTVTLLKSADVNNRQAIGKSMTIDGSGLEDATVKVNAGKDDRVFDISGTEDVTLTLKGVYADGSETGKGYDRGVSLYGNKNVKLVLDDASVSSPYYAINIAGENEGVDVEMKNASASAGWSAFNVWSPATITVSESELSGNNDKSYNNAGWNNFGTIVMNKGSGGSKLSVKDSTIVARMNGNRQLLLDIRDDNIEMLFDTVDFKAYGTTAEDASYSFKLIGLYDASESKRYAATNTKLIFKDCNFFKDDEKIEDVNALFSYLNLYNLDTLKSTFVFDGVQYFFDNLYDRYRADYATLSVNDNREFIGGLFYDDPSANVADGYAAVKMTEDTWKVGPVSSASTEIITTGKDTYTVTTTVKESKEATAAVLSESSASVSVQPETVAAEEVKTTETVSLANIDTKKVAETAAAMAVAAGATEATDINVTIKLEKQDDTEAQSDNLEDTFGGAQEVFEVHPVATYTATKTVGDSVETIKTETFTIANDDLEGSFTFNLYLDSTKYSSLAAGSLVTVTHYKDDNTTETWTKKVQQDEDGNLYVELTLSSFSHVAVKAAAEGATVNYTVKIADATSGTAVIYPGDSVTMDVTVSGDDFYGGDFTISYDKSAFDLGEVSLPTGISTQSARNGLSLTENEINYNLVNSGNRLSDGSTILTITFTAKSGLAATATYDFKVTDARVNYDNTKNADIVNCDENNGFVTNDAVKVNATQYTVTFDGVSKDWTEQVYAGKGVVTIPTDVKTGYTFKGWALTNTATTALTADAIRNAAVTANVTYYPVFEAEQYAVTLTGTTTDNEPAKATFGQDYTATISGYDANNYDYTVTYKSGTDASKTLDLSAESNFNAETGAFTIPAADITGELKVTVEKTLKGFEVELHPDYVTGYTLVLVKKSAANTANPIYTYDGNAMFFVNELTKTDSTTAYGAYATLVEGRITKSAAEAKVGITETTATTLSIAADVNATELVDSSDLQASFSGYKVKLTFPDQMAIYLRADINGDYKLDTTDVGLVNSARTK